MNDFVHLHCHSEYSLLDGAGRINDLVNKAKASGMQSIALTDHGNIYGAVQFQKIANKAEIKPIIGCEFYMAARTRHNKDVHLDRKHKHLTILVKNEIGYKNLTKLITISNLEGFYYKPRIDFELLKQHNKGLVVLSGCSAGEVAKLLKDDNYEKAKNTALKYRNIFDDDYYLEIMDHGLPEEKHIKEMLINLSKETDIPLVATNDVHYVNSEDSKAHDVLLCIQTNSTLKEKNRFRFQTKEVFLKDCQQMQVLFKEAPESISNTVLVAEKCNYQLPTGKYFLPDFPVPNNTSPENHLKTLCKERLSKKYNNPSPEIENRLNQELEVISNMGFAAYFLIVQDFIAYAKSNNISVGPGRGSAAGSIVSYLLDITSIDPLKYGLLFERFLNPERISMPDIDIDFCIKRRDEVIGYVAQKYGSNHVSQIITFGTMAARAAIRDVGRVFEIPLPEVDYTAKLIPTTPGITIKKALEQNEELRNHAENNPHIKKLLEMAQKLEGLARHSGTHAAGVVISKEPLTNYVALQKNEDQIISQFPMEDLESIGLLKMDFLGLRNLTIIDTAIELIKENQNIDLDINTIPMNDQNTYSLLQNANTIGVFQLESRGMRSIIKDLKPNTFEDIIALLALYRPGPLGSGMVREFIDNKHTKKKVRYLLPELEPILQETYGLILYQEQVMKIASILGGFSLGQADMLRRAMGKKKKEVMDKQKKIFIEGADKKGFPKEKVSKIFDLMAKFAEYGFNKSHSTAYAFISYHTAFLKANYPLEFIAALLTSVSGNTDKISQYITDAKKANIEILSPDINESSQYFTVVKGAIRFGLGAIKNVGDTAIKHILKERDKGGPFISFGEFCSRIDLRTVNKKVCESLIKVGAMSSMGKRAQLLEIYEKIIESISRSQKEQAKGQISLFEIDNNVASTVFSQEVQLPDIPEFSINTLLKMEKELTGLYISDHPLNQVKHILSQKNNTNSIDLKSKKTEEKINIGGIVANTRKIITKNGSQMLTGTLEDLWGHVPFVVFPGNYDNCVKYLQEENLITLHGKIKTKNDELQIIVTEVTPLSKNHKQKALHINIKNISDLKIIEQIKEILTKYQGPESVYIHTKEKVINVGINYYVTLSNKELVNKIAMITGKGNVWID